jgi:hypothetical protein
MKKGKTSTIKGFKTAKVFYGTVDSVNFKSLYLNIQTWVEPKQENENWNRVVLNMSRNVKHSILESIEKKIFDDKFIVDLDLRSSGLNPKKKSFMNLEVNFYISTDDMDFKSSYLKESLKKITNQIFINNFQKNEYFKFYLTKKTKTLEELTQTDNV